MLLNSEKSVEYLVVDTTAFIENVQLQTIAQKVVTVQDVVDEIKHKRQLRRLCVLPYDLIIKDVFPESISAVTEFSKITGDYPCLSHTDIKVMALTYQLEKEHVGTSHLRDKPIIHKSATITTQPMHIDVNAADVTGFYVPGSKDNISRTNTSSDVSENLENVNEPCLTKATEFDEDNSNEEFNIKTTLEDLQIKFKKLDCEIEELKEEENILINVTKENDEKSEDVESETESDDEDSWITPTNVHVAKKKLNSELLEEKNVKVACITTDFAMQNVLKQMNLNVSALDGRMIKQLRTFILRCYTCYATTSIMTKVFCQKCGHNTLKRVAVSIDENGKQQIHINVRKPLTGRGKRFSLPTIKGGKHSNNPILFEDQPVPDQQPSRLAKKKNNPMEIDYVAGFSPFVTRDVNSKSAQLGIRPAGVKHWMQKNPNQARRKRQK